MSRCCSICGKPLEARKRKYCSECLINSKIESCRAYRQRCKERMKGGYVPKDVLTSTADTTQCKTCRYWNKDQKWCDYLTMTGHSRGCDPSPNCTEYRSKQRISGGFGI